MAFTGAASSAAAEGQTAAPVTEAQKAQAATRAKRMKWWHEAKFGMFIHWGLYSVIGQHEWAMEVEGIPIPQYEILAKHFNPKPNAARDWARLAKQAGQKYMVMTTKHHEGFCHWDTKLTDYCAPKQGPGRDLVREFVDAARAEGSARRLLLLADGLAPSRWRDVQDRRSGAASALWTTRTG